MAQEGSQGISKTNKVLVESRNLVKAYKGRRVVNGVSIQVCEGEVVGLLGPNGAGKTTSFYMITGLIRPDSGTVHFRDIDISKYPMYKRSRLGMGYLAQEPSIFRKLTVEQNIMAILETLDLSSYERKERLKALLNELEIDHLSKQKAVTLSGGERRRLEITRALVTNPSLILLDEPFSGVDPLAVYDVQQVICRLRDKGLSILITDHNVRETLSVVNRAYLLCEGQIVVQGTSDFLVKDPKAREVYLGPKFTM
ncbi:MAG TPA: LPS export ABC transporter ATP-binding protein [Lentisphaeria bacterium]|nr:MAG: LPS export ABC transporter ATP-binding protein [Lentisphaerae bacterium GWF2_38_69]HBM15524.1 LPS export ABC transporter ATP-binding protein [Lentisphaeria bacterium]